MCSPTIGRSLRASTALGMVGAVIALSAAGAVAATCRYRALQPSDPGRDSMLWGIAATVHS